MPVRIEPRIDLHPARLYNHFEATDSVGRRVSLTAEDIEASIKTTVNDYLSKQPLLVVAYVHEGVNLLGATKIVLKQNVIDQLINHPNLLGLAVVDAQHSYFKHLIEIAKNIRPTLKISVFNSLDELETYVLSHPAEFIATA